MLMSGDGHQSGGLDIVNFYKMVILTIYLLHVQSVHGNRREATNEFYQFFRNCLKT
jgi:hypothetical protein